MSNILKSILAMAEQAEPLIGSLVGTPLLGLGIKAAQGVLDLGHKYKEIHGSDDEGALDARLDALQARVNAHADDTIASLD